MNKLTIMCLYSLLALLSSFQVHAEDVDPVDNENLGFLLVKADNLRPHDGTIAFDPELTLSTPKRLVKGTYCIELTNTTVSGTMRSQLCGVVIKARQTTTIQMSTLTSDFKPQNFSVDIGRAASFGLQGWSEDLLITKMPVFLVFPQTYSAHYSSDTNQLFSIDVSPGKDVLFSPAISDRRVTYMIELPSRRFENAREVVCGKPNASYFLMRRPGLPYIDPATSEPVDPSKDGIAKEISLESKARHIEQLVEIDSPKKLRALPDSRFELLVNGLAFPVGPPSTGTLTLKVRRIDVNDIKVTREDGSTYMASGTYIIQQKGSNWWVAPEGCTRDSSYPYMRFPTKTGIDVPPGEYSVYVQYATEEGSMFQRFDLDLRY